jgi:hypothetical protein
MNNKYNTCKKRNPKLIYLFVVEKFIVMMCIIFESTNSMIHIIITKETYEWKPTFILK